MSSLFDRKKIVPRYKMLAYAMLLVGVMIICRALYISTVKRDYWMQVASRLKKDSVDVKPTRGNILSCDGRLMASSLPEFKLYMDFKALHEANNDSLWEEKVDSICMGLNHIFPQKSAAEFKQELEAGRAKQSAHMPIWPKRVDYSTFSEVKRLPVFNLISYKGGFHYEEFNARKRPFGSLAGRTVGDIDIDHVARKVVLGCRPRPRRAAECFVGHDIATLSIAHPGTGGQDALGGELDGLTRLVERAVGADVELKLCGGVCSRLDDCGGYVPDFVVVIRTACQQHGDGEGEIYEVHFHIHFSINN